ncbi:MAG: sugar phosphate isomerase/epimerase family protein [Prolixibacteraceae bacterium]
MKTNQSRRDFVKISSASAMGLMLLGPTACSTAVDIKSFGIGLQLYSIRDAMLADVAGTLKKVSDLGFKNLEMANYSNGKFYGFAPKEFNKMTNDLGLEIISSHAAVESTGITVENGRKMADDHAELGVQFCVQPWVNDQDRTIETYKRMIGDWNKVGEMMKEVGIQFGYHNHNFEFANIDGIVPYYDIFIPEMDANLITMELDLFWATKAGQDPVEMFNKFPGRFKILHLKDMTLDNSPYYDVIKDDITSVGAGLINFKRILAAADIAGTKYTFVEDDNQGNGQPFEALKTSINNLSTDILIK